MLLMLEDNHHNSLSFPSPALGVHDSAQEHLLDQCAVLTFAGITLAPFPTREYSLLKY